MIEMLVVLMLFSFLLLLFPMRLMHNHDLMLRMEQLKQLLLWEQSRAIQELMTIRVELADTKMDDGVHRFDLGMTCSGFVIFHPNGNVDHAKTITCHQDQGSAALIIQLGSGRMTIVQ